MVAAFMTVQWADMAGSRSSDISSVVAAKLHRHPSLVRPWPSVSGTAELMPTNHPTSRRTKETD